MPTDVIKKIGVTNSPITMDYSTLQSFEDAAPANLVTADQRWIGECYNQGEFTGSTQLLTVSGETTDATRYIILRCASGAGFKDDAGAATNPLVYDATKGVAIRSSVAYSEVIGPNADYTQIIGVQVKATATSSGSMRTTNHPCTFDSCIFDGFNDTMRFVGGSTGNAVIKNCLVINRGGGPKIAISIEQSNTDQVQIYNCTVIGVSATTGISATTQYGSGPICKNTAIFGFTNSSAGVFHTPSGFNATDKIIAPGTSNQTSLTFASQFVSTTVDFRAVATGSLKNGTPDSTNAPTDIIGTTRDATTPYIGAWEVAGSSGFTQEGSGLLKFTGLASVTVAGTVQPVGQLQFTGIASRSGSVIYLALGQLQFTGIATQQTTGAFSAAGQLRFNGLGSLSLGVVGQAGGQLTITGLATEQTSGVISAAGALLLSGIGLPYISVSFLPSGKLLFNGLSDSQKLTLLSSGEWASINYGSEWNSLNWGNSWDSDT